MNLTEIQNRNTENFLQSYNIRCKMREVSGYDEEISEGNFADCKIPAIKDFDKTLAAGQVRLLPDAKELTYVLLLHEWEDNAYVVSAFSHYAAPATDEELQIAPDAGLFLNTLQMWNTRTLRNEILEKSWLIGNVSEEICEDAWLFWSSMITGEELPERLLSRTGIPISDDEDIRLEYMAEESQIFSEIDANDLDFSEEIDEDYGEFSLPDWLQPKLVLPALWSEKQTAFAAGDEKENIRIKCNISETDNNLLVEYSQAEGALYLEVYDKNFSQESRALDGAQVIDAEENILGVIQDGFCKINDLFDFDGSFGIKTQEGKIYTAEEIEG